MSNQEKVQTEPAPSIWVEQWVEKKLNGKYWFSVRENEVWKTDRYAIVFHRHVGLRLMLSLKQYPLESVLKLVIEDLLDQQEE